MEIQELIFFYHHESSKIIEVHFRLNIDSEEEFRTDMIDISESSDFGYELITEDYNLYDVDDDEGYEELSWLDSTTIDEDDLISFLNEYYIVYPDKVPKPELI